MKLTKHEGYAVEAALDAGFEMTNEEGDEFRCSEAQIIRFSEMARSELIKEIERLREALRPFADRAAAYDPPENDDAESDWWNVNRPTIGDLRKARAALGEGEQ